MLSTKRNCGPPKDNLDVGIIAGSYRVLSGLDRYAEARQEGQDGQHPSGTGQAHCPHGGDMQESPARYHLSSGKIQGGDGSRPSPDNGGQQDVIWSETPVVAGKADRGV